MNTISSEDLIIQELAEGGFKVEIVDEKIRFTPTMLRVDHLTVKRKQVGRWIRDPEIYGRGEDNIFWHPSLDVFATINDEQVPIYFNNPENMLTWSEERIDP